MVVNEGQMVCVELVAKNPLFSEPRVLFLGSIKYEALKKVYETRVKRQRVVIRSDHFSSLSPRRPVRVRVWLSACLWECTRSAESNSFECAAQTFVEISSIEGKNPFVSFAQQGKGHAEMAVSRSRTMHSGITTPESVPSTPMSSSFDEESVSRASERGKTFRHVSSP